MSLFEKYKQKLVKTAVARLVKHGYTITPMHDGYVVKKGDEMVSVSEVGLLMMADRIVR